MEDANGNDAQSVVTLDTETDARVAAGETDLPPPIYRRTTNSTPRFYYVSKEWKDLKIAFATLSILFTVVLVAVVIPVGAGWGEDSTSSTDDPEDTQHKCFESSQDLQRAISCYQSERSLGSLAEVQQTYGSSISSWCTELVSDFSGIFRGLRGFNEDLSGWETTQVTSLAGAFAGTSHFAANMSQWKTSRVVNMSALFADSLGFASDISNWDVSGVIDLQNTFRNATDFVGGDLAGWNTSSVLNMASMFRNASSLAINATTWDTSHVSNFSFTFRYCSSVVHGVSGWNVSSARDMRQMFAWAPWLNESLCSWGLALKERIDLPVSGMFQGTAQGTSCPVDADPDLSASPPGPFCSPCV